MKKIFAFLVLSLVAVCCLTQADAKVRKGSKAKTTRRVSKPAAVDKPFKGTFEYEDPSGAFAISMNIDLYDKTVDGQNGEEKCYGVIEYATERGVHVYDITEVEYLNHNGAEVRIVGDLDDEYFIPLQEVYLSNGYQTKTGVLSVELGQLFGVNSKKVDFKRVKQYLNNNVFDGSGSETNAEEAIIAMEEDSSILLTGATLKFYGDVGNYPVEMTLTFDEKSDKVSGVYRYTKSGNGKFIALEGTYCIVDNGFEANVTLQERYNGKVSATWSLNVVSGSSTEAYGTMVTSAGKNYKVSLVM